MINTEDLIKLNALTNNKEVISLLIDEDESLVKNIITSLETISNYKIFKNDELIELVNKIISISKSTNGEKLNSFFQKLDVLLFSYQYKDLMLIFDNYFSNEKLDETIFDLYLNKNFIEGYNIKSKIECINIYSIYNQKTFIKELLLNKEFAKKINNNMKFFMSLVESFNNLMINGDRAIVKSIFNNDTFIINRTCSEILETIKMVSTITIEVVKPSAQKIIKELLNNNDILIRFDFSEQKKLIKYCININKNDELKDKVEPINKLLICSNLINSYTIEEIISLSDYLINNDLCDKEIMNNLIDGTIYSHRSFNELKEMLDLYKNNGFNNTIKILMNFDLLLDVDYSLQLYIINCYLISKDDKMLNSLLVSKTCDDVNKRGNVQVESDIMNNVIDNCKDIREVVTYLKANNIKRFDSNTLILKRKN